MRVYMHAHVRGVVCVPACTPAGFVCGCGVCRCCDMCVHTFVVYWDVCVHAFMLYVHVYLYVNRRLLCVWYVHVFAVCVEVCVHIVVWYMHKS